MLRCQAVVADKNTYQDLQGGLPEDPGKEDRIDTETVDSIHTDCHRGLYALHTGIFAILDDIRDICAIPDAPTEETLRALIANPGLLDDLRTQIPE